MTLPVTEYALNKAYRHLNPGGWIEIQELDARANCDDASLPPNSSLAKFFDTAEAAVKSFGMNFRAGEKLGEPLQKAGFINVGCIVLKVPIGAWAKVGFFFRPKVTHPAD